ncbi:MAG: right-handed parallel beta-helix repeat-containing protein, partial [Planctomycetota bacterium]
MKTTIILVAVLSLPVLAFSATLNVPGDYLTIQEAIDAAVNGDTVLVAPGTYVENIDFLGKAITVMSSDGADITIIDGNYTASVVTFQSGEGPGSVLEGFTLTNGLGNDDPVWGRVGGGVYCFQSSPLITKCTIKENAAESAGGGIYCGDNANPAISMNLIMNNSGGFGGGGIFCRESSPDIAGNIIIGNSSSYLDNRTPPPGGGIYLETSSSSITNNIIMENVAGFGGGMYTTASSPTLINCTFSGNWATYSSGGGMYNYRGNPTVTNCTFSGNKSVGNGGGMANYEGIPTVTNCILWNDSPNEIDDPDSYLIVNFSCIQGGWPGTGNVDTDPLFADPGYWDDNGTPEDPYDDFWVDGDYHLTYSPCIDAGDNIAPGIPGYDFEGDPRIYDGDGDGTAIADMGCDEAIMLHVPKFYLTIQAAISAASYSNPVVVVWPGTYFENIDFIGKAVTVLGIQGPGSTTIDGSQVGSVVTFQNGEGKDSHLTGFTLTNGAALEGGGIYCSNSSPLVENSIISQNASSSSGGGVYCLDSSPALKQIEITGNSSTGGDGGGIFCSNSSPSIENGIISENKSSYSGGGVICLNSAPVIVNTCIYKNSAASGGGFFSDLVSFPIITNSVIHENSASSEGGGVSCGNGSPTITNSIVWKNNAPVGSQIQGTNPVVNYCDVQGGWPGTGNINADPLFLDPGTHNFHLTAPESPCINTGDNYAPEIPDLDYEGDPRIKYGTADMGADEYLYDGGGIIYVPQVCPTIQEAINEALTGDLVQVDPGAYIENVN